MNKHLGKQICPICKKPVGMYSYILNKNMEKIHIGCDNIKNDRFKKIIIENQQFLNDICRG